ncbi:MAG: beta-phosphoglucomutase [Acholeplasmataceae bacterium]
MRPNYQLAIFDLDGVLTETSEMHFKAWSILFKKHFDIRIDPKLESLTKGVSRMDSIKVLLKAYHLDETLNEQEIFNLAQEKNKTYQSLIKDLTPKDLFDGVIALFDYLKGNHIKIALGSASKNGPLIIEKLGITHYFDVVVDPSKNKGKPAPDIFLSACHALNLSPHQCIGFEDAKAGVTAIKKAGMTAIGIGSEDLSQADYCFKHIKDVPYDLL